MKYLVFAYDDHGAKGGWNDFWSAHNSRREALGSMVPGSPTCFHIVEQAEDGTGTIVVRGRWGADALVWQEVPRDRCLIDTPPAEAGGFFPRG